MTYLALQDEVLDHQISPSKYRPSVKRWLNDAQRRAVIESELRTQEETYAFSTEAGTAGYSLPVNFARIIDLHNSATHGVLSRMDRKAYDGLATSSGSPSAYAVLGSKITLYPTPDTVYPLVLRYWKLPEDMVKDEDEPEIPPQYHELLAAWALKKAFLRENDPREAQTWREEWERGIFKMRGEAFVDAQDGPRQVPGLYGEEDFSSSVWSR